MDYNKIHRCIRLANIVEVFNSIGAEWTLNFETTEKPNFKNLRTSPKEATWKVAISKSLQRQRPDCANSCTRRDISRKIYTWSAYCEADRLITLMDHWILWTSRDCESDISKALTTTACDTGILFQFSNDNISNTTGILYINQTKMQVNCWISFTIQVTIPSLSLWCCPCCQDYGDRKLIGRTPKAAI